MVLASRGWLVSSSRAARNARGAYARLLLLSGIVAVAWLAGGVGVAHSETASQSGGLGGDVLGVGEITDRTGQAAEELRDSGLSDTASRAASSTEALAGSVVPQASSLPGNALRETGAALEESSVGAVVHETGQAVDDTARGATGLVAGVARTSQGVVDSTDESLRESALVDSVATSLNDTVGRSGIDSVTESGGPLGLPILGSDEEPAVSAPTAERSDAEERERAEREREERVARVKDEVAAHVAQTSWRVANEVAENAGDTASDDDSAERIRLIGGGSHHQVGPDTTGASAPSFPAPGAAGFLMARAGHMALRAQRVALPGDPTLVVRDAADDPSYSPD
ncbi:hypothetical protein [Nocardiopsis sp. L17-MgMaSL7]|uniref:hypothetical protein n=1 Tax=Nocardiopsis sp. L17-MgMaSL7 TaxID=1938893 RepID=UPI000D71C6AB|nr:hypothetical protein [Nocardiopsis sp. L17-MgMaSL7]PWV51081.1 hypothetical protein BDW27_107148 [Nocardiopsis sp. L17-MgMaSL7]